MCGSRVQQIFLLYNDSLALKALNHVGVKLAVNVSDDLTILFFDQHAGGIGCLLY
jgi:hypothetical protein